MKAPFPPSARVRLPAGERREAILAAAKGVFGRSGYHASTRDVAAAAGVSEALLYQHFPGKRQLFCELVEAAAADLERRLLATRGLPERLEAGVAAYFAFVEEESELYRLFFRQAAEDPAVQDLRRALWRRFIGLMREETGLSEAGAHGLAGMLNELALWWLEEAGLTRNEIVERALRYARAVCESEVDDGAADRR